MEGLSSGTYMVTVWADNGEDNMTLVVSDYETHLAKAKQDEELKKLQPVPRVQETRTRTRNNKLQFVNEVYLEENDGSILLTVERRDESKYSVVLRDPAAVPYVCPIFLTVLPE
jgi:hypothetical protein